MSIVLQPAALHFFKHCKLLCLISRCGVGLGYFHRHFANGENVENGFGKCSKPKSAFDKAARLAEAFGNRINVTFGTEEMQKSLTFVGWCHFLPEKILGETGFGYAFGALVTDHHWNTVIFGNLARRCEYVERAQPSTAGKNVVKALFLGCAADQVLQHPFGFDIGNEPIQIGFGTAFAHIMQREPELVEWNDLNGHSEVLRSQMTLLPSFRPTILLPPPLLPVRARKRRWLLGGPLGSRSRFNGLALMCRDWGPCRDRNRPIGCTTCSAIKR